jgi:hypothetical protein
MLLVLRGEPEEVLKPFDEFERRMEEEVQRRINQFMYGQTNMLTVVGRT